VHAVGAGEMSATVVREPQAWTKATARIKADIVQGRDDADLLMPNLKVGVSTNFNKLVSFCRIYHCLLLATPSRQHLWQVDMPGSSARVNCWANAVQGPNLH
jgi:hypothetical protein